MASDGDAWFSAEAIAYLEGTTERWVREKYTRRAEQMDATERLWKRHVDVPGSPPRVEFPFALLEPATQAKLLDSKFQIPDSKFPEGLDLPTQPSRAGGVVSPSQPPHIDADPPLQLPPELSISSVASPSTVAQGPLSGPAVLGKASVISRQSSVKTLSLAPVTVGDSTIDLSAASQQLLPLDSVRECEALAAMPESKRPWARARRRAIAALIPNSTGGGEWEMWRGQTVHGVSIRIKSDFVCALAVDSRFQSEMLRSAQHGSAGAVLVDWASLNDELRRSTRQVGASITPLSVTTIWRMLGDYQHGKVLSMCAVCRGVVDQKTARCEACGKEQRLPPGLQSLQDLDRSDKGQIALHPMHAEWLTALYLGGDSTVRCTKLALERPRSAAECLEILKLEINAGELPAPPPSYHQVKRWINEALPRIVRDYAREGRQRALAKRGPYIPRRYSEDTAVNDCWICDFRRVDVRAWIEADEKLFRIYLCAVMDAASRDVIFRFDLYPSAQLFKSTLRAALLRWGRPRDIWLDNGKEFTCEDVMGGAVNRTWSARVDCDEEALSTFDKLGISAHFAIKYNPNGKAELERFFRTFYSFELTLPGFTQSDTKKRPERLKHEELEHTEFCRGLRPATPLLRVDKLVNELTRFIDARYRHRPHTGYGMHHRTPAQVQAAFDGVRQVPNIAELDILLWHRKRLRARGDKVSFDYRGSTFIFRADELLALPGDCEVEIHVDPLNADRALALTNGRPILLEPVNPTGGRTPADVAREMERKRHLEKQIRSAALLGSTLAPVPSPERYLQLLEADAARKQTSLDGERRDRTEQVEIPEYAEAAEVVGQKSEIRNQKSGIQHPEIGSVEWTMAKLEKRRGEIPRSARNDNAEGADQVALVDPRYRAAADQFFKKG